MGLILLLSIPLTSLFIYRTSNAAESLVLFNGYSLEGWHINPERIGHGTGGQWRVEDGILIGEQDPPGSGNGGILLTDQTFSNFELSLEMKPDWGVCSGVFLRSNNKGQCFQMMVDYHDGGNIGHIYGEGTGGFNNRTFNLYGIHDKESQLKALTTKPIDFSATKDFSISGPDWVNVWKLGEWNHARIRVVDTPPEITTWINGVKISELDARNFVHPKYNARKVTQLLGSEGSIAVQVHGGKSWPSGAKCRWRKIKITPL